MTVQSGGIISVSFGCVCLCVLPTTVLMRGQCIVGFGTAYMVHQYTFLPIKNNRLAAESIFCLDYGSHLLLTWEVRLTKLVFVYIWNHSLIIVTSQSCFLVPLCWQALHVISSSRHLCVIIWKKAALDLEGMDSTGIGGEWSYLTAWCTQDGHYDQPVDHICDQNLSADSVRLFTNPENSDDVS